MLLLLSFWFFRGLVAALLPLLVGGFAIVLTFLALRMVDQFTPISVFALNLVSGMGLGLGIDYSLFVLYRYREELAGGADAHEAIARTLRTAGRTVLFSCLTVAAAMTSLLVFPIRFLSSMGIGGAVVTLCGGAVALLVLPAVLIVLGPRINALSPAWLQRRAARSARATERRRLVEAGARRRAPARPRRADQRGRPARRGDTGAAPAVHLARREPAARRRGKPPGRNRARQGLPRQRRGSDRNRPARDDAPRRCAWPPPRPVPRVALASVSPRSTSVAAHGRSRCCPTARRTPTSSSSCLRELRALAHPYGALVGGATAFFVDQKAAIASHIPLALLILLSLTAGFLFLMTGSVTIPIKALVMNMLSVSVAVGLQVLIFQDGHLSGLLGFTPLGGLEESSLVLMLVIAFALATDYEVFVIARIKEAHDHGLPDREAIALGIERTGRIITAAALLFCVAIGALTTSDLFFTKQLGLGAALAVAVDASIVRALLVPSLMALMGKWNWWAPRPLQRLHDRIGLQESTPAGVELR